MNPYILMPQPIQDVSGLQPVFQNTGQQQANQQAALAQQNQLVNQAGQSQGGGMNPMALAMMLRKKDPNEQSLGSKLGTYAKSIPAIMEYGAENVYGGFGQGQVPTEANFDADITNEYIKAKKYMKDCWVWLYRGAWHEWEIHEIEMAVPLSPYQVLKKRNAIFCHQSQKDGVMFQGDDSREFWLRAEERNRLTATKYHSLGLADYAAIESKLQSLTDELDQLD